MIEHIYNAGSNCAGAYEGYAFKLGQCIKHGKSSVMYSRYSSFSSAAYSVTYTKYDDNSCKHVAPGFPHVWNIQRQCEDGKALFAYSAVLPTDTEHAVQEFYATEEGCEKASLKDVSYVRLTPGSTCINLGSGKGSLMMAECTGKKLSAMNA
jgi:hypothetical protein